MRRHFIRWYIALFAATLFFNLGRFYEDKHNPYRETAKRWKNIALRIDDALDYKDIQGNDTIGKYNYWYDVIMESDDYEWVIDHKE